MRKVQLQRPPIRFIGLLALCLLSPACGRAGGEAGIQASVPVEIAPTTVASSTASPTDTSIAATPVTVQAQGFAQDIQSAAYGFVVANPDGATAWENVAYQVTLKTADDTIVGRDAGTIATLLPGQTHGVAGTIFLDSETPLTAIDVALSGGRPVALGAVENFTVSAMAYLPSDYGRAVSGIIHSPFDRPLEEVRVSAIAYDAEGRIIGGGFTFAGFVPPAGQIGALVLISAVGEVARVELYPAVSPLSILEAAIVAPADALPIELLDAGIGQGAFESGYGLLVRNPNTTYPVESSRYQITAFDDRGTVVATYAGDIHFLLPGQTLGVAGSIFSQTEAAIATIDVQVLSGEFIVDETTMSAFTTEAVTLVAGDFSPEVSGTVVNPNPSEVTNLQVSALAFDEAGHIIGGGFTFIDAIPAAANEPVSVPLSVSVPPARVELFAAVTSTSICETGSEGGG